MNVHGYVYMALCFGLFWKMFNTLSCSCIDKEQLSGLQNDKYDTQFVYAPENKYVLCPRSRDNSEPPEKCGKFQVWVNIVMLICTHVCTWVIHNTWTWRYIVFFALETSWFWIGRSGEKVFQLGSGTPHPTWVPAADVPAHKAGCPFASLANQAPLCPGVGTVPVEDLCSYEVEQRLQDIAMYIRTHMFIYIYMLYIYLYVYTILCVCTFKCIHLCVHV